MNTKLTLRLSDDLINEAKNYAKKEGKSLSQLVTDFFVAISSKKNPSQKSDLMPKTFQLYGSLKDKFISKDDYNKHIEKKYL
ncbi:MAG: antitoxin [Desulfobacteraceae bacterium]|nr:MAG: antitoxin [Desulfobacteraceae bacterium]